MGAGFWVAQEGADALIELRSDDVFEAAGLHVGFGVFDGESVGEKAFGEAVAADYVTRAARAGFGQMNFAGGIFVAIFISIGILIAIGV